MELGSSDCTVFPFALLGDGAVINYYRLAVINYYRSDLLQSCIQTQIEKTIRLVFPKLLLITSQTSPVPFLQNWIFEDLDLNISDFCN